MQRDTSSEGLLSEHDEDGSDSHPPASSWPEGDVASKLNKRSAMQGTHHRTVSFLRIRKMVWILIRLP